MTKAQINPNFSKSKGLVILEHILFAICLCAIALRTTFTEGLSVQQSTSQLIGFDSGVYSLSVSAVLFCSFTLWFVWSFCSKKFCYRFSGMEIGLYLLCVAAVAASFAAANKRAAITDAVCLIAPVLTAVLLVQILDSQSKIKLLLAVIAALGVVSAYQCAEQFFVSNQAMIDQYEQAPQSLLGPLGIRPGTLQQFLFEHRLYTRGVRGFFTTSNSAGSFALLASFAAIALFLEKLKVLKFSASRLLPLLTCGIAVAVVVFGFVITQSKGAIGASLIAAAMFVIYLLFGNWIKMHKRAILITCLLLGLAGGGVISLYGLTHGRLPGGNSMLVRWQYWQASVQMYADYPLTGVGPGNFANLYPHYKPAAALETVADPHNFPLSVLTQYGPLGLVGFLALFSIPLWRVTSSSPAGLLAEAAKPEPVFRKLAGPFVIVVSAVLLFVRPIIMPVTAGDDLDVIICVVFLLYVVPVIAFIVGFWLLTTAFYDTRNTQYAIRNTNITTAALFCACLGVILHNLIDFAIFEPGVFMTLWAVIAALTALDFQQGSRLQFVLKPAPLVRVIAVTVGLIITWAYFNYCLIPVVKSTSKIKRATQAVAEGKFPQAYNLLNSAAKDDGLSPFALSLNGRLYLQNALAAGTRGENLLIRSERAFLAAIRRNQADFKNFERLTRVYNLLAETPTQEEKSDWLNKAFDSVWTAKELYPGSARLRVALAEIAEQLGKTDIAIGQYQKAIDIEDSFRAQFQIMYPEREIFSRLGEDKYNFAIERVKGLSENSER